VLRSSGDGTRPCLLLAGGGTGGHVFPALAVAEVLQHAGVRPVFVGTPRGLERTLVPARGFELELLDVAPMTGAGVLRFVTGALTASRALAASFSVIAKYNPRAVLSVGGYAAGPISLACALRRIPLALLEPNCVLGFTNRVLAPFAARAYVAWEAMVPQFRFGVGVALGVPIRAMFRPKSLAESAFAVRPERMHLLVLGGSQGAQTMNTTVPLVLARLAAKYDFSVTHQTGANDVDRVRDAYTKAGMERVAVRAFVEDAAAEMTRADLVIARAGASTVAEICAVGCAAILVPFPHAAADHQTANAEALVAVGGAVRVHDASLAQTLPVELERVLQDPSLRTQMARSAQAAGRPQAAGSVARDLMRLGSLLEAP
jgi:UDP-N-acetylglucosamine--N-acetylmuramyl-(pentapeptide) pyrophosphoryl-undecaprenol N-acetylglucosamine transferase